MLLLLLLGVLAGTAVVVLRRGGLLLGSRVHEALSQLPNKFACTRGLVPSAATTTMATTEELVCKATKAAQWAGAAASATATTVTGVLSAEQSVHSHASESSISRGPIYTARPIGHDWFHGTVRMAHSLRSIRVRDKFRRLGSPVRVFTRRSGSVARLSGLSRDIPLRNTSRQLDIVVFLARAIPLSNPTRGQRRRSKRGTISLGRGRASHGQGRGRGRGRSVVYGGRGGEMSLEAGSKIDEGGDIVAW